jgi:hypothetical protein
VKQVGKNVAMNAAIANENFDETDSLMQWMTMIAILFLLFYSVKYN